MTAAIKGYQCIFVMPEKMSSDKEDLLCAYGAEVIRTANAPRDAPENFQNLARSLAQANGWFLPDQFANPANPDIHARTTGPEIWRQSEGRVTHFVAGIGTSGTLMGVGKFLRRHRSDVGLIAVQPDSPIHGLEGIKHLETAFWPGIYEPLLTDEIRTVRTEDAQAMVRRLAHEEGLLVGTSAGANVHASLELARSLPRGVVVTLLCDHGSTYLSQPFWEG